MWAGLAWWLGIRLVSRRASARFHFGSTFLFEKGCGLSTVSNCDFDLKINETLKWLSSLTILMQESFWWWQCSDRYIASLFPHLHPHSLPSLISHTVSARACVRACVRVCVGWVGECERVCLFVCVCVYNASVCVCVCVCVCVRACASDTCMHSLCVSPQSVRALKEGRASTRCTTPAWLATTTPWTAAASRRCAVFHPHDSPSYRLLLLVSAAVLSRQSVWVCARACVRV